MVNCKRCEYMNADNGNCTAVGGFCTAVPAAHCVLLQEYMDAYLTPAEVHSLWYEWNDMMSVLNSIGSYDRLRELAEADKAGRAVILPCEPGTTVYMTFCGEVWEMRVGQFHVNGYTKQRIWADIDCDWANTQCVRWDLVVGKTVFLTREDAEAALKERRADNG